MLTKNESASKDEIRCYFDDLNFRINNYLQHKKHINVYLSTDFNVFNIINPDENKISNVVYDLLNTSGTHGQNDLFLNSFLSVIGMSSVSFKKFKIFREDSTKFILNNSRRIDITIDFDNFGIGIENKPWSYDQTDQIKDYNDHLNKKYKENYKLVYMVGDGRYPTSIDKELLQNLEKQGKLIIFPYPTLFLKWLELCKKQCESEKFRWFIRDFIEYINTHFTLAEE